MDDQSKVKRELDELAHSVRERLKCDGVLITQVTHDRQIVMANSGLQLPTALTTEMPLPFSICQHVVAIDFHLVIDDAASHPMLHDNLAVSDLGIHAYLGAPVHIREAEPFGATCALQNQQRHWSYKDIENIMFAARRADGLLAQII